MGQKIHPIGFRVGITKNHQSQWYARFHKHQYSQSLLEDHILRKTLMKLFGGNSPELLQSSLKLKKKLEDNVPLTPKITQIKIERGLIPYEIGIQIHAGNCDLIKSSIDQLKLNQTLTYQLQKSRCYLMDLKFKLKEVLKWKRAIPSKIQKISKLESKKLFPNFRLLQQRLRKHQGIKRNFRQSVLNKLGMVKKGKTLIRQFQVSRPLLQKKQGLTTFKKFTKQDSLSPNKKNTRFGDQQSKDQINLTNASSKQNGTLSSTQNLKGVKNFSQASALKNASSSFLPGKASNKKFLNVFFNQMNQLFLKEFQKQMKHWNNYLVTYQEEQRQKKLSGFVQNGKKSSASLKGKEVSSFNLAPLGYNRKWSLSRLNRLKNQPIQTLRQLVKYLQSKALLKLEILREEFVVLGYLSKTQAFDYYQMIRFIKNLKLLVKKLAKEQLKQKWTKNASSQTTFLTNQHDISVKNQKIEKFISSLSEKALKTKLENIEKECRKLKFISYLKEVVKNHRKNHVYYYLATLSDSRQSLEKIQKFQKQNAYFLFGVDSFLKGNSEKTEWVQNQIQKSYLQIGQKPEVDKNLPDAFLDQLQKKKSMYQENIQFTPKIIVKFYNVQQSSFESKASLVADSIVDDLEKRKPFRRVIKQAKETLMTNSGVKGVKIQVAGRLNGAEIARTEWVRSGRVPLQTLRANIDYSSKTASTIYGIIGVKVWIYKGFVKIGKTKLPSLI